MNTYYADGRTLIDDLPADIAEGVREYGRRYLRGLPQDDWTRSCRSRYQHHRLAVKPGARAKTRSYYAAAVGRPVAPRRRKYA